MSVSPEAIDTVVVDSLKALDLERPIREAEVVGTLGHFLVGTGSDIAPGLGDGWRSADEKVDATLRYCPPPLRKDQTNLNTSSL
jgi:hypothetical protein